MHVPSRPCWPNWATSTWTRWKKRLSTSCARWLRCSSALPCYFRAERIQSQSHILPKKPFDLIITHNPNGEYTRHLRHEEVSKAVIDLWHKGKITATELWTFAYEDGNKTYFPKPIENAPIHTILTEQVWLWKYQLMTETYGFKRDSWEAQTTPKQEAFWQFQNWDNAKQWLAKGGK